MKAAGHPLTLKGYRTKFTSGKTIEGSSTYCVTLSRCTHGAYGYQGSQSRTAGKSI